MKKIKISIAQLHYTAGKIKNNCKKIISAYRQACKNKSKLIVFSDLAITGYPPSNIMLQHNFQEQCMQALKILTLETKNKKTFMLVGGIWVQDNCIYNSMFLLGNNKIFTSIGKHTIDYESIYHEADIFTATLIPKTIIIDNIKIQIIIGSDISMHQLAGLMSKTGVEIIIITTTKPYTKELNIELSDLLTRINKETMLPIIYLNQVGGNKNIAIKGGSLILSAEGKIIHRMPEWQEHISHTEWIKDFNHWTCVNGSQIKPYNEMENIYYAMIRSLDDFITQHKFNNILINFNNTPGSIISIIIASNLSSKIQITAYSLDEINFIKPNHIKLLKNLKIKYKKININKILNANKQLLEKFTSKKIEDKNIKAKIITTLIDSIANINKSMILSTVDKTNIILGKEIYENIFAHYNVVGDLYQIDLINMLKWLNKFNQNISNIYKINKNIKKLYSHIKPTENIKNIDNALQEVLDNGINCNDLIKIGYSTKIENFITKTINKKIDYKNKIIQPLCISKKTFNTLWSSMPNSNP